MKCYHIDIHYACLGQYVCCTINVSRHDHCCDDELLEPARYDNGFRVLCSFISICDEFFSQAVKQKYQSSKFMRISAIEELQSSLIEDWAQKAQEEATVS